MNRTRRRNEDSDGAQAAASPKSSDPTAWFCDVCQEASFDTHQEAVAHEAMCDDRRELEQKQKQEGCEDDGDMSVISISSTESSLPSVDEARSGIGADAGVEDTQSTGSAAVNDGKGSSSSRMPLQNEDREVFTDDVGEEGSAALNDTSAAVAPDDARAGSKDADSRMGDGRGAFKTHMISPELKGGDKSCVQRPESRRLGEEDLLRSMFYPPPPSYVESVARSAHISTGKPTRDDGSKSIHEEAEIGEGDDMSTESGWECDICKDAVFASYEEAMAHEKQCTGKRPSRQEQNMHDTEQRQKPKRGGQSGPIPFVTNAIHSTPPHPLQEVGVYPRIPMVGRPPIMTVLPISVHRQCPLSLPPQIRRQLNHTMKPRGRGAEPIAEARSNTSETDAMTEKGNSAMKRKSDQTIHSPRKVCRYNQYSLYSPLRPAPSPTPGINLVVDLEARGESAELPPGKHKDGVSEEASAEANGKSSSGSRHSVRQCCHDGCTKLVKKGTKCSSHRNPKCKHAGCEKCCQSKKDGFCWRHYKEIVASQNTTSEMDGVASEPHIPPAQINPKVPTAPTVCQVDGCTKDATQGTKCWGHTRSTCQHHTGCKKGSRKRGLCAAHHREEFSERSQKKRKCKHTGCEKYSQNKKDGFCWRHYKECSASQSTTSEMDQEPSPKVATASEQVIISNIDSSGIAKLPVAFGFWLDDGPSKCRAQNAAEQYVNAAKDLEKASSETVASRLETGEASSQKVAVASIEYTRTISNSNCFAKLPVAFGFFLDEEDGASESFAKIATERWIALGKEAAAESDGPVLEGKSRELLSAAPPGVAPAGPDFPDGWTTKPRSATTHKAFLSPQLKVQFATKKKALIFVDILRETGVDGEEMALDVFKSRGYKTHHKKKCKHVGCEKLSQKCGLCRGHYRETFPDGPAAAQMCHHPGCEKYSRTKKAGFCWSHYAEFVASQKSGLETDGPVGERLCIENCTEDRVDLRLSGRSSYCRMCYRKQDNSLKSEEKKKNCKYSGLGCAQCKEPICISCWDEGYDRHNK